MCGGGGGGGKRDAVPPYTSGAAAGSYLAGQGLLIGVELGGGRGPVVSWKQEEDKVPGSPDTAQLPQPGMGAPFPSAGWAAGGYLAVSSKPRLYS